MCQTCLTSDLINEQEYSNITNTIQCDTTLDRKLSTVYKKKNILHCISIKATWLINHYKWLAICQMS